MAAGDAAGAAGLKVYTGNENANQLWIRDNERGDEIAAVKTALRPVETGGTAASTASQARTNLGIPPIAPLGNVVPQAIPVYDASGCLVSNTPATPGQVANKAYVDSMALPVNPVFGTVTATGSFFSPNAGPATSGYAVAYFNGDGRLSRGTSSRRYKKNLRAWTPDVGAVLDLALTEFEYRASVDADSPTDQGLVAEDVADLGLEWLVIRDDQGRPDAVRYERLALGLLAVVQDLTARLNRLEGGA